MLLVSFFNGNEMFLWLLLRGQMLLLYVDVILLCHILNTQTYLVCDSQFQRVVSFHIKSVSLFLLCFSMLSFEYVIVHLWHFFSGFCANICCQSIVFYICQLLNMLSNIVISSIPLSFNIWQISGRRPTTTLLFTQKHTVGNIEWIKKGKMFYLDFLIGFPFFWATQFIILK